MQHASQVQQIYHRAPVKVHIFICIMPISSPNPMFDALLELTHRDDSNKGSIVGFGEEITQVQSIEVHFMHFIWSSINMSSYLHGCKTTNTAHCVKRTNSA